MRQGKSATTTPNKNRISGSEVMQIFPIRPIIFLTRGFFGFDLPVFQIEGGGAAEN